MWWLSWSLVVAASATNSVQVDSAGGQVELPSRAVTFVNMMSDIDCSLYWVGRPGSGPRIFYGPVTARGGERTIEGYPGQTFSLTRVGTYEVIADYTIEEGSTRFTVTDRDAAAGTRDASTSEQRELTAKGCRDAGTCTHCTGIAGCGWSPVRRRCFLAHPIATANDPIECQQTSTSSDPKSANAWLNRATSLVLGREGYGPRSLRAAYRALERGVQQATDEAANVAATAPEAKAAAAVVAKLEGAMAELAPKLEAVFDDEDARDLLGATRHRELAAVHPSMPAVDRRTFAEARAYISRAEPVVITDLFDDADASSSPIAHKWTL